jgi:hypothetical protein
VTIEEMRNLPLVPIQEKRKKKNSLIIEGVDVSRF